MMKKLELPGASINWMVAMPTASTGTLQDNMALPEMLRCRSRSYHTKEPLP